MISSLFPNSYGNIKQTNAIAMTCIRMLANEVVQFAQELLSTFGNSLGEVALQPSTGGTFIVNLYHAAPSVNAGPVTAKQYLLWDRKAEGGFPGMSFSSSRPQHNFDYQVMSWITWIFFLRNQPLVMLVLVSVFTFQSPIDYPSR